MIKKNLVKNGYTLVEMIIYISLLSIISIAIMSTIISFMRSYKSVQVVRIVDNSGIAVMERITREIRGASNIDTLNSDFVSNPGYLTLITGSSGNTTKFYVQDGVVKVDVNGTYIGPITQSNTSVTGLKFTLLDNGISKAIKTDLTIQGTVGQVTETKIFHSTIILRGR